MCMDGWMDKRQTDSAVTYSMVTQTASIFIYGCDWLQIQRQYLVFGLTCGGFWSFMGFVGNKKIWRLGSAMKVLTGIAINTCECYRVTQPHAFTLLGGGLVSLSAYCFQYRYTCLTGSQLSGGE